MFDKLRGIFGGTKSKADEREASPKLSYEETAIIGTEDDPLHGYEAAIEHHEAAMRADQSGDPETAIKLYEKSVAERFVGSHPYEALATLHERRQDHPAALRAIEAYITLARNGHMPPEPKNPPTVNSPNSRPAPNATDALCKGTRENSYKQCICGCE